MNNTSNIKKSELNVKRLKNNAMKSNAQRSNPSKMKNPKLQLGIDNVSNCVVNTSTANPTNNI